MRSCTCSDPNSWEYGPCDYCTADWCDICQTAESGCDCNWCDACGDKADHTLAMHKFEQDELWCWEKFGCLEQGDHYHTDEINAMKESK